MEQPLLVYYCKDFGLTTPDPKKVHHKQEIAPKQAVDSVKTVKSMIYGLGRNEILLRVNNLEDKFDATAQPYTMDLLQYAWELFAEANPQFTKEQLLEYQLNIEEVTLSGTTTME